MEPPKTETRELTEHERLHMIADKSHEIGQFIEWLHEQGIEFGKYHTHSEGCWDVSLTGKQYLSCSLNSNQLSPYRESIERLLSRYFDIDLDKLEREKREMLADIRKQHAAKQIEKELGLNET